MKLVIVTPAPTSLELARDINFYCGRHNRRNNLSIIPCQLSFAEQYFISVNAISIRIVSAAVYNNYNLFAVGINIIYLILYALTKSSGKRSRDFIIYTACLQIGGITGSVYKFYSFSQEREVVELSGNFWRIIIVSIAVIASGKGKD